MCQDHHHIFLPPQSQIKCKKMLTARIRHTNLPWRNVRPPLLKKNEKTFQIFPSKSWIKFGEPKTKMMMIFCRSGFLIKSWRLPKAKRVRRLSSLLGTIQNRSIQTTPLTKYLLIQVQKAHSTSWLNVITTHFWSTKTMKAQRKKSYKNMKSNSKIIIMCSILRVISKDREKKKSQS